MDLRDSKLFITILYESIARVGLMANDCNGISDRLSMRWNTNIYSVNIFYTI